MAHKQSYVTVMLNKCRYSSEIAVFDMSTVFETHARPWHHSLKLLSMKHCDTFCHSVIIAVFSNSTVLDFHPLWTQRIAVNN